MVDHIISNNLVANCIAALPNPLALVVLIPLTRGKALLQPKISSQLLVLRVSLMVRHLFLALHSLVAAKITIYSSKIIH
jgi:hypothetical protein